MDQHNVDAADYHVCLLGLDHGIGYLPYSPRSRSMGLNAGFMLER
jgi:hypothetical protein